VNTKLKAQLLEYWARKNSQQGLTFVSGLVAIAFLASVASIPLLAVLSQRSGSAEIHAIKNIRAMTDRQRDYHYKYGEFADSVDRLTQDADRQELADLLTSTASYEYSIRGTHFAAFQYATALKKNARSYLGIVVKTPHNRGISTKVIYYCQQNEPGVKPSEPILQDGVIQCGENMTDLGESGSIEVGKDWEVAFRAWQFASQQKYDRAIELAETIANEVHQASALQEIAHELIVAGEYDRALELTATIPLEWYKTDVLSEVVPHLTSDAQHDRTVELAASITNHSYQVQALQAIVPHLTTQAQYDRVLELVPITISYDQPPPPEGQEYPEIELLKAIVPHLTTEAQHDRALVLAASITERRYQAKVLEAIAPHLATQAQYDRALELAASITNRSYQAKVLKAIAPHLTTEAQYDRVLELAETISDDEQRGKKTEVLKKGEQDPKTEVLKAIAPHLTERGSIRSRFRNR
jgi:tetratricopeptide (TPR) repeat protein